MCIKTKFHKEAYICIVQCVLGIINFRSRCHSGRVKSLNDSVMYWLFASRGTELLIFVNVPTHTLLRRFSDMYLIDFTLVLFLFGKSRKPLEREISSFFLAKLMWIV